MDEVMFLHASSSDSYGRFDELHLPRSPVKTEQLPLYPDIDAASSLLCHLSIQLRLAQICLLI